HFVIEALKGAAATGGNEITLAGLSDYVSRQVADYVRAKYGRTQTPELIGKLRGGFPFVRLVEDVRRAHGLLAQGDGRGGKKEYDKALADYNEALHFDPKYAYAYHNRGLVWHAKREYAKAVADYTEAVRLDPKYTDAFHNRGYTWHAQREYDKALADYTETL